MIKLILFMLLLAGCSCSYESKPMPEKKRETILMNLSPVQREVLGEMTKIEQAVIENCLNSEYDRTYDGFSYCIERMRTTLGVCPTVKLEDNSSMKVLGGAVLGYGAARLLHGGKRK